MKTTRSYDTKLSAEIKTSCHVASVCELNQRDEPREPSVTTEEEGEKEEEEEERLIFGCLNHPN
jgi:hypothetical protein